MDTRYLSTNGLLRKITDVEEMEKTLQFVPDSRLRRAAYLNKSPVDYSFNELHDILQKNDTIVFASLIQKPYALLSAVDGYAVVAFSAAANSPDEFFDMIFAFHTVGKKTDFCRMGNYHGGPEDTKKLISDFTKISGVLRKPDMFKKIATKILPIVY